MLEPQVIIANLEASIQSFRPCIRAVHLLAECYAHNSFKPLERHPERTADYIEWLCSYFNHFDAEVSLYIRAVNPSRRRWFAAPCDTPEYDEAWKAFRETEGLYSAILVRDCLPILEALEGNLTPRPPLTRVAEAPPD